MDKSEYLGAKDSNLRMKAFLCEIDLNDIYFKSSDILCTEKGFQCQSDQIKIISTSTIALI